MSIAQGRGHSFHEAATKHCLCPLGALASQMSDRAAGDAPVDPLELPDPYDEVLGG